MIGSRHAFARLIGINFFVKILHALIAATCYLFAVQTFGQTSNAPSQVIVWGNVAGVTNVPDWLTNVVSISAGRDYCLAIEADGSVGVWGDPNGGYSGDFPTNNVLSNVIGLSPANHSFFVVTTGGTVVSFPYNPGGPVTGLTNVISLSFVDGRWAALLGNGAVVAGGTVGNIDLSILPPGLSNAVAVSAGEEVLYALTPSGQVYAWGNEYPGYNTGATSVPVGLAARAISGSQYGCMVLQTDGTVTNIGQNTPAPPPGLSNVTAISAADGLNGFGEMALTSDGTVVTWGGLPSPPTGMPYVQAISAGNGFCMALVNPTVSLSPPVIVRNSPDQTVAAGSEPVESVVTFGPVLGYQWYFNATNAIGGATNQLLFLPNIQEQQSGQYTVIVSNASGSVTSLPMALSVLPALGINMVPALTLKGGIGLTYNVQYINPLGPTNAPWTTLATVTLTNSPEFYSDYSAIGQPSRFYRIVEVP